MCSNRKFLKSKVPLLIQKDFWSYAGSFHKMFKFLFIDDLYTGITYIITFCCLDVTAN